jgi:hypothetical protein
MSTSGPDATIEPGAHRILGVTLYNHCWDLLVLADRTPEQTDELIHAAHASRHHWAAAATGEPWRLARGEWLCSRVYAVLGRPEPSLWHARRCLAVLERDGAGDDWDVAAACEAMARAYAVAGDGAASAEWRDRAIEALDLIEDPEDRLQIEGDLASIPT